MKLKTIGAVALAIALGAGGATALAGPASAHVPSISATCAGLVLHAEAYDGAKLNTWTATVGGVTTSGTFGATYDATIAIPQGGATTQVSATIADADLTPAYTQTLTQSVGPCGTAPTLPAAVWPAGSSTCNTYTLPVLESYEKYPLADINDPNSRYTAGTHPLVGTVTVDAHTLAADTTHAQGDHVYTFTASTCAVPPIVCTSSGPYHESDDNAGTPTDAGVDLTSLGDGKPVDFGYSVNGNAQGITGINWSQDKVVGNGFFFRLIYDLSGDGGSAYNSFSGLGTHVDQSTVAGYGSKAVFAGKTIADVGTTWPHNKLVAIIWQTGSTYAKGDGGLLTAVAGDCVTASYIKTVTPPTTTPPTVQLTTPTNPDTLAFTGATTGWLLWPAGAALLLGLSAIGTHLWINRKTRYARTSSK